GILLELFDERVEVGLEAVPWTLELRDSALDARRVQAAQLLQHRFELLPHHAHLGRNSTIYKRIAEVRRSHDTHVEIRHVYRYDWRCEQCRCPAGAGGRELLCALRAARLGCRRQTARLRQGVDGPAELLESPDPLGLERRGRLGEVLLLSHLSLPDLG